MGKHAERLKKNSLKPKAASHKNGSWYADTDWFLEHSPSVTYKGTALQKIIKVLLGSLLVCFSFMFIYFKLQVCREPCFVVWDSKTYAN